jgi:hypothetical protein
MVTKPSPTSSPTPDQEIRNGERPSGSRKPPILASEALREEVAPLKPWNRAFRVWDGALGLVLALMGLMVHLGTWPSFLGGPWVGYALALGLVLLAL